jgi:hypothetical protein
MGQFEGAVEFICDFGVGLLQAAIDAFGLVSVVAAWVLFGIFVAHSQAQSGE